MLKSKKKTKQKNKHIEENYNFFTNSLKPKDIKFTVEYDKE